MTDTGVRAGRRAWPRRRLRARFTVNGEDVTVGRGQATYFPMGDRHGLRVAEGDGISFLEFHIPAGYTTVRG